MGKKMNKNAFYWWGSLVLLMVFLTGCINDGNQLTVEFRDFDDSLILSSNVVAFEDAVPPSVNRPGYDFLNWEETSADDKIKVFTATYLAKTFTISFETGGGSSVSDMEVTYDQEVSLPQATKTNCTFLGWTYEGESLPSSLVYRYDHDLTLFASFANLDFQIIFYPVNGTTIPNLNVYFSQVIEELPIPELTGYTFLGWRENGVLISLPYTFSYDHDLVLVASYAPAKVNVEFQDDDGTILKTQLVHNLGDATCEEPKRFGYSFSGWERINSQEKVIFKATYEIGIYKITFASNTLQSIQSSTITFGQTVTGLPTPTKEDYMFMGWYLDGVRVELPYEFNLGHDITLFARWEKTNFPTVPFQEIFDFGQKVDGVIANAHQYHYTNINTYNFKGYVPNYGTVSISSGIRVDAKVDKTANYYENRFYENNVEMGYDIYKQIGTDIYLDELAYTNGKYFLSTSLFSSVANFFYEDISVSELFDPNGSFRKIDYDHYLVYTSLGNLASDDFDVEELAEQINLSWEILSEIVVEVEAIYSEQTKQFAISVEIKDFTFEISGIKYTLSINLQSMVDHIDEAIVPFDNNQSNVLQRTPTSIAEINTTTDISSPIVCYESPDPHYYRVQLEQGLYEVSLTDFWAGKIEVFDESLKELNYHPLWNNQDVANNNCFLITTAGLYYVKVNNLNLEGYTLGINKITYETMADFNEPLLISDTNDVICEGKFDYAFYGLEAAGDGVLIIDALGASPLIYSQGVFQRFTRIRSEPDRKFYVPLAAGTNDIVFGSSTALSFSFNCTIIYDNPDTTEDLATMPVLTTTLSSETYLVGYHCETDYFRLNVISGGIYTIRCETQSVAKEPYVEFYLEDGSNIYASQTSQSLEPGVYYIKIHMISDTIIYRIKYEVVFDQTKTLDFSIATFTETNYLGNPDIPKITGILPTKNSKIYHKFIITEPSLVYINNHRERIELFNEQMKVISFDYDSDPDYYKLDPGIYYIKICYRGNEIDYSYAFAFCILSNEPIDDYPSNTFGTIALGTLSIIKLDFMGDIDYYHFSVLETKNYYFRFSMNFALFNANDELIIKENGSFTNKDIEKELEAGEYYFIFFHERGFSDEFGSMSVKDIPF